ncbi:MAG: hypothetical protein FGF51_04505 [Candidatus Brockarchaeota archaeon]|nr:hypothetical protein [Candidatus Brockarchaeota archaeon]
MEREKGVESQRIEKEEGELKIQEALKILEEVVPRLIKIIGEPLMSLTLTEEQARQKANNGDLL